MKAAAKPQLVTLLTAMIAQDTRTSMPQSTRRKQVIKLRPLVEQLAREIKHGDK